MCEARGVQLMQRKADCVAQAQGLLQPPHKPHKFIIKAHSNTRHAPTGTNTSNHTRSNKRNCMHVQAQATKGCGTGVNKLCSPHPIARQHYPR